MPGGMVSSARPAGMDIHMTTDVRPVPSDAVDRVRAHTHPEVQARLDRELTDRLRHLSTAGREAINRRLAELDDESDVERVLEANAATLALAGVLLGTTVSRRWLLLPAVVLPFLLQHAVQGWCPPLTLLRRFGVRTAAEINAERYALKVLRGDFTELREPPDVERLIAAVRR
jgi:hypothetical protein